MKRCNQLSLDVNGLFNAIHKRCETLIKDTATLIEAEFAKYIVSEGAGRTIWREHAAEEFKIIVWKLTNELIEAQLGMPPNLENDAQTDYYAAQIMVALYGNHPPLYTKPGEQTWHYYDPKDARLTVKTESHAKDVHRLPASHEWDDPHADEMLKNCMKNVRPSFKDGVHAILRDINFYDYVHVTAG